MPALATTPAPRASNESSAATHRGAIARVASLSAALVLACSGCARPPARTPEPTSAPVATAAAPTAEQQFKQWLAAFDAGDRARLTEFNESLYTPELAGELGDVDGLLAYREDSGGLSLLTIETSTPTRCVALVEERENAVSWRFFVELDGPRLKQLDREPLPVPRQTEAAALEALRAEIDRQVARDRFAGAVLVAKDGAPIFAQAYGLADRAQKLQNTLETRFRIGSMNKMFTAVATLQLVQAKKLALDDTVGEHLPDYPNKDVASKVTIHHLLTHTGGTGDIFGPEFDAHRSELRELADYVKLYGERGLEHAPGERFEYSNYGFLLLGVIVARVSKQTYYDRVQARVFKPAGMTATSSPFEDKPARGRSIAYTRDLPGGRTSEWTDAAETLPIRATSAGGGDSTVHDLLRFAEALKQHKLLDAAHTELLWTGKIATGPAKYAYGFAELDVNGVRCVGHGGGAQGMNGSLLICDSGYTVAALANLDPPAAERVGRFIASRLPAQ